MRRYAPAFTWFFASLSICSVATAAEPPGFKQKDICAVGPDGASYIDPNKLAIHRAVATKKFPGIKEALASEKQKASALEWARSAASEDEQISEFLKNADQTGAYTVNRNLESDHCRRVYSRYGNSLEAPILYDNPECIRTRCLSYVPAPDKPPSQLDKPKVFVRDSAANFNVGVDSPTAKPAIASIVQNLKDDYSTGQVKIAAGVKFSGYLTSEPLAEGKIRKLNSFSFFPYIMYEKKYSTKVGTEDEDINKLGFGGKLLANYGSSTGEGLAHAVSLQGAFLSDDKAESAIADGKLLYYPLFDAPGFRRLTNFYQGSLFGYFVEPYFVGEFGHVFDAGMNTALFETNNYLRAGAGVNFTVTGMPDDYIFWIDNVRWLTSFVYMHGFDGSIDEFYRFDTGLYFNIGESKNFGFALKYINGYTDTTLQRDESFEAALTVKF